MRSNPSSSSSRLLSPEVKARSAGFYTIARDESSITCHACGHLSRDPHDVQAKYCPRCLVFHEDRVLMSRLQEGYQEQFQSRSHPEQGIRILV